MSDDFDVKVTKHNDPERHGTTTVTLAFSGRVTLEIETPRGSDATLDLIASTATRIYTHVSMAMSRSLPMPMFLGGGGPEFRSPSWLLEKRVSELRTEIADLRDKLAERTAQRDELRRIFEPPPAIPTVVTADPPHVADLKAFEEHFGQRL